MRLILVIGLVVVGYLLTVPCILHVMVSMMMCGQLFSCPEDARWKLNYYGEEGSVRGERYVLIAGKSKAHYQSILMFSYNIYFGTVSTYNRMLFSTPN